MLGSIISAVITALASVLVGIFKAKSDEGAARKDGQAEVTTAVNKETSDATDRMAEANAVPRSRSSVLERLRNGSA